MERTNDLVFTTEETAELLKVNRKIIDSLRKTGCLNGIKLGKTFIFSAVEINRFLEHYEGADLSNEFTMQEARRNVDRRTHDISSNSSLYPRYR